MTLTKIGKLEVKNVEIQLLFRIFYKLSIFGKKKKKIFSVDFIHETNLTEKKLIDSRFFK